jgi:hypothetical protein
MTPEREEAHPMDRQETATLPHATLGGAPTWRTALNGAWHRSALLVFLGIVTAHWAEHLFQAYQVYVLDTARPHALGALGMLYPWLVHSEWLHFGYAAVMLLGLTLLQPGFVGRGARWWRIALLIQAWHLFEHTLLLAQASLDRPFWCAAAPTSILQLVVPRVELHLFYNAVVFVPMVIAMVYHLRPSQRECRMMTCSCIRHSVDHTTAVLP